MSRLRLTAILGFLCLAIGCVLPCYSLDAWVGASFPFQDATPELLEKQAADIAAAERGLAVSAHLAAGFLGGGVVALIVAWKGRRQSAGERGSPGG